MVSAAAGADARLVSKPTDTLPSSAEDDWELAVAADTHGHMYVLYPEYDTTPASICNGCLLPALTLLISNDAGSTWQSPLVLTPPASGQFDPQIVVDPVDQRTVYAAWLQNSRRDILLAKSADFGQSWSIAMVDHGTVETGKPALAVRGQNVYVASGRSGKMWMASSHDGGITFSPAVVSENPQFAESLAGGATVDPEGNVYLAWSGWQQISSKGRLNLYVSKSSTGGKSWSSTLMDVSNTPADCSAYHCKWGYLGAQITIASDAAGMLYALWSASSASRPERIFFASSTTSGATWSAKTDVSTAPRSARHMLPSIGASDVGSVRIAWIDSRNSPDWDGYFRSSTNGGATWSAETPISSAPHSYGTILSRISGLLGSQ